MGWSADFQKGQTAYQNGDFATALHEWKPLAEQGYARAQYLLGLMYLTGRGVPLNHKTAVKWCKLAAEQRNAYAQFNLGFMYDNGHGVPKTTVKRYRLAAEQGVCPLPSTIWTNFKRKLLRKINYEYHKHVPNKGMLMPSTIWV
jgi:hypothetical protein